MNEFDHRLPLRPLSSTEREYIERLLSADFPGRDEIAEQVASVLVRSLDDEGSIELVPQNEVHARVSKRIPVEGEALDSDGVPIHFLLHVVESRVRELEIYKDDGSRIRRMPVADEIQVVTLPA